jgi:hypothetical protein
MKCNSGYKRVTSHQAKLAEYGVVCVIITKKVPVCEAGVLIS